MAYTFVLNLDGSANDGFCFFVPDVNGDMEWSIDEVEAVLQLEVGCYVDLLLQTD